MKTYVIPRALIGGARISDAHCRHGMTALLMLASLLFVAFPFAPSARAQTAVATVSVGSYPISVAYDFSKGEVFVANSGDNTVSVISDSTNKVVATVSVGMASSPWGIASDSIGGRVFVSNGYENFVSVISDVTNTVVATVSVGSWPAGIAYDFSKVEIFVANSGDNTISVVSVEISTAATTTSVTCSPSQVTVGAPTSCTASVAGNSPTGTVAWTSGGYGTFHPSSCALASGQCLVSFTPLSATTVTVAATYGGDSSNTGSSDDVALVVTKASSTTSVTCLPSTVTVGSSSSCVAAVNGYSPTGNVTFTTSSGSGSFSPSDGKCILSSGRCSVTYFDTEAGTPQITLTYNGDTNNRQSAGSVFVSVVPISSSSTTSTTTSSSSTTSSSGGSGIPEFPVQLSLALLVTAVIVTSYVIARRVTVPRL